MPAARRRPPSSGALAALAAALLAALAACESASGGPSGLTTVDADGGASPILADARMDAAPPGPDAAAPADLPVPPDPDLGAAPDAAPPDAAVDAGRGAPALRVTPAGGLDFGPVAQGIGATRPLTLGNEGQAPLTVASLRVVVGEGALSGEFALVADAGFPPTTGAGPGLVGPDEVATVLVAFTNLGPAEGAAEAALVVASDDPRAPERMVPLRAARAGEPNCAAALEPETFDFGRVAHGAAKDATFLVRNVGTGRCGFRAAAVHACTAAPAPFLPGAECTPGTPSEHFAVVGTPIPSADGLGPGEAVAVRVRFEPPPMDSTPFGLDEYAGLLHVTMADPYAPAGAADRFEVPPAPATGAPAPNLLGRGGTGEIAVVPGHLDFGLVTVGCAAPGRTVTVTAGGTAPLLVTAVEPGDDCAAAFAFELPPIPADGLSVTAGAPLLVAVRFTPDAVGEATCTLTIHSSDPDDPAVTVTIAGEGVLGGSHQDTFAAGAPRPVDVLFVIDDSGSMCETQDRLGADVAAFLDRADQAGLDYRVGVVSTCVQGPDVCAGAGELRSPWFVAPAWERWVAPATRAHLAAAVELGCNGGSDAQEAGLQAAWLALTDPRARLTETVCGDDGDCPAPDRCLPDLGRCGGANGGFLREEALLELVFLSDEDDQSVAPPEFYLGSFLALKGGPGSGAARAHAIVGDDDGGCVDPVTLEPLAEAGARYHYLAEQTGGVTGSICADSYGPTLAAIAAAAAATPRRFRLSRVPAPATLRVRLGGADCADGWSYDLRTNSVELAEGGACWPAGDEPLAVSYDVLCATGR
jgi:hypothetical protein